MEMITNKIRLGKTKPGAWKKCYFPCRLKPGGGPLADRQWAGSVNMKRNQKCSEKSKILNLFSVWIWKVQLTMNIEDYFDSTSDNELDLGLENFMNNFL